MRDARLLRNCKNQSASRKADQSAKCKIAEQIIRSPEQHRALLRQRIEKNMPDAKSAADVMDVLVRADSLYGD